MPNSSSKGCLWGSCGIGYWDFQGKPPESLRIRCASRPGYQDGELCEIVDGWICTGGREKIIRREAGMKHCMVGSKPAERDRILWQSLGLGA